MKHFCQICLIITSRGRNTFMKVSGRSRQENFRNELPIYLLLPLGTSAESLLHSSGMTLSSLFSGDLGRGCTLLSKSSSIFFWRFWRFVIHLLMKIFLSRT
ncbi:unnamed protein product [Moneuplotes crassus]|uniref:Uncharacterized protein n=1 Tax=Euplotes crassus TaxID=5936 RepID=A0AAD1Y696_EUPCR|nr:unnamed protein product [Moneuplotes crassus]